MSDTRKKIGQLHLDIYKETDVTLVADLVPEMLPTDKYDYVKLALLAAEIKNYLTEQLHVINTDEDNKINKLTDLFVGDVPDDVLSGKRKPINEQEQLQLDLVFKDDDGEEPDDG